MFRLTQTIVTLALAVVFGCSTMPNKAYLHRGESLVLVGQEKGNLAFPALLDKHITVRSTYLELPHTVHYELGRDYTIDNTGQIQRAPNSRIPDFRTNILYGQENFNHAQFPGFGNSKFFVYVDYYSNDSFEQMHRNVVSQKENQLAFLPETQRKLRAGGPIRIIAFGDSITAGGDASEPRLIFWQRWADELQLKYPRAQIQIINGATGGDRTHEGLMRLDAKVLTQKPDLVLVGFGMNDHNIGGYGVPLPTFSNNLRTIIDQVRSKTGAELILYSAFPPNPKWAHGSHNMEAYALTTEQVAREKQCAFADVYHLWQSVAVHKKPEDLLANNINHPNDYGHWLYLQALKKVGL